jgi:hypothetical protein
MYPITTQQFSGSTKIVRNNPDGVTNFSIRFQYDGYRSEIHIQKEYVVDTMINRCSFEHASLTVSLSMIVKAKRKTQALEMADFQLNEKNMVLDRIRLVNDRGNENFFLMERIESIQWNTAESTDYSNLFKVRGLVRITLIMDKNSEQQDDIPLNSSYRLPKSVLQDRTVWVVQTSNEPAFTQVISQSLEFIIPKESLPLTNAG